jgi:hypothetical protein
VCTRSTAVVSPAAGAVIMQIWQVSPKTKTKTYTFYYKDGKIAAARSSAGGLALLRL